MARCTTETAQRVIAQRNAAADRVRAIEDRLYRANVALREAEAKCWKSLPEGASIRMGGHDPHAHWDLGNG